MSLRFLLPFLLASIVAQIVTTSWSIQAWGDDSPEFKQWGERFEKEILPIVKERCVECHQGDDADGEFDISGFTSGGHVVRKKDVWESVAKRVRQNEMPPEGSPSLNDAQKSAFHSWLDSRPQEDLCSKLATDETQAWYRGYVMSRRLTRTEYLNSIRDLVGVTVNPNLDVPSDGSGGEGFDTNGETLFTSPIHIEQYLAIASHVIEQAISSESHGGLVVRNLATDASEDDVARASIERFARLAWRRVVANEEVDRLMAIYSGCRSRGMGFFDSVGEPLQAILVSPNFLFIVETESAEGGVQKLTPHQLATRLSMLIWSSGPDELLLDEADAGRLDTDEQIIAQVQRMLGDPKSRALGESFGLQWLGLTNFRTSVRPDHDVFPEYSDELSADLYEEAIQTVAGVFRESGSLLDLLDAKHVVVNGRLAMHYGLSLPPDSPWQRIETSDRRRGGVLTLGAVLVSASYPRRTSPVLRGRWVLEEILGGKVPPPPPGVPALEESVVEKVTTLRERLELHRENAECASCHNRMDPLGFGLENYDALGRWRDSDNDIPIDSSGKLPSGEEFNGPEELKQLVMRRSSEFEHHFVRKLLGYALGRELNKFDDCVIQDCKTSLAQHEHRASVVLETIATSYPFRHRYFKAAK